MGITNDFIFGVVTGIDGQKSWCINGVVVNPVGLKNKINFKEKLVNAHKKYLENPNPDNVVLALVYRVEHENFTEVLDLDTDKCDILPPKIYAPCWMDGFVNRCLNSLMLFCPCHQVLRRDEAKRVLKHRMESLG